MKLSFKEKPFSVSSISLIELIADYEILIGLLINFVHRKIVEGRKIAEWERREMKD